MSALQFPQFLKRYNIRLLYVSDLRTAPTVLLKKVRQGYEYQGHIKDYIQKPAAQWDVRMIPGSIVYGTVEKEVSLKGRASVEDLGLKIGGGLGMAQSISYSLRDVKVKVPANTDPLHIAHDINEVRRANKNAWRAINGLWMPEKTYHVAAFDVKINSTGKVDWEAELKDKIVVGTEGDVTWTSKREFTVTNTDAVPFGFTGIKI